MDEPAAAGRQNLRRCVAWVAATLVLVAAPACTSSADTATVYDGSRRVDVDRVGPPRLDDAGRLLSPVHLWYPGRTQPVEAAIDRTAVVRIADGADPDRLLAAGARPIRPLMASIGLWLVEDAGDGDGLDVAVRLRSDPNMEPFVVDALPNLYLETRRFAEYTPNDPRFGGQWYFENLHMTEAWGLTQGDAKNTIVVVDTGCDLEHPDLAAKMDPGLDVVDGDDDPSPDTAADGAAHGTECAGVAAAVTDNAEGIAGACPACRLRCVRLLSDVAQPISTTIDAYDFALEVDAAVVSNSWGYVDVISVPGPVADAINAVFDTGRGGKGALVLFAAGNDDREIQDDELQAVRGVLGIGAINNFDEQTPFTNYGNAVNVVVQTGTLTTDISGSAGDDPTDYTSTFGGTSSACPVAAGIAGLLVSAAPERTSAELYEVMVRTARPAPFAVPDAQGHDPVYGFGILDPVGALEDVLGLSTGAGGSSSSAASSGGSANPGDEGADEGCSCAAVGSEGLTRAPPLYLLAAATVVVLRRRRRASRPTARSA